MSGDDADGDPVADATDDHSTDIDFGPELAVTKSGPVSAAVGDTVTYTFDVTNDAVAGDGSPITITSVTDDVAGVATSVDIAPPDEPVRTLNFRQTIYWDR